MYLTYDLSRKTKFYEGRNQMSQFPPETPELDMVLGTSYAAQHSVKSEGTGSDCLG